MEIIQWQKDIYVLDDGRVREFLILGEKEALLIDTGFSDNAIKEIIAKITSLPIRVLLTHGDGDHRGGLSQFDNCCFHQAEHSLIQPMIDYTYIKEGDCIDIGAYHFDVIEIPGHTEGSIALLEPHQQWLIVGDTVQKDGPIYMFGSHRNLKNYIESLKKLQRYQDSLKLVLPSHHEWPICPDYITYCLKDAEMLLAGKLDGIPHPSMPCWEYFGEYVHFYYNQI